MKSLRNLILLSVLTSFVFNSANAQNVSSNVALNKPATASSSTTLEIPVKAFDGVLNTNWCTPGFTGWIKVDLQTKYIVDSIRLYVNQAITGNTVHEIKISEDMDTWTTVKTLSGITSNNQILSVKFNPALSNVRGVMINTISSNSWVSWYEIEVYSTLSKPTIIQNGSVLTSSSTINNQWYLNGSPISGATSQTYTAIANGTYQVGVTEGGNQLMSEVTILTTETNEVGIGDVKIYPNPAKDNILVEGTTKGKIEILNLQGQVIKYVNASDKKTSIELSKFINGIYTLKIPTDKGVIVKKLLKQ